MAGTQAFDTEKLTRMIMIAIVATFILVAAVGLLFAVKTLSVDSDEDSRPASPTALQTSVPTPVAYTTVTEQNGLVADRAGLDPSHEFAMPFDASSDDSAEMVECYTPDDPHFSPAEFNVTSADYGLSIDYYKLLFEKKLKLKYTPLSVIVNVGKGPLVVSFKISDVTVTTGESSTGGGSSSKYTSGIHSFEGVPTEVPYHSFLNLKISDNSTGEVVKQGGFGREYPSTDEQDLFIYETGEYRVDMYGNGLDVDLKIFSGTTPENPDAIGVDTAASVKFSELAKTTASSAAEDPSCQEEAWW